MDMGTRVRDVMMRVADQVIMPSFGAIRARDIDVRLGEVSTMIDRKSEALLTSQLAALIPDSVIIGEEGVASDPSIIDGILSSGFVWVIDPLDGTTNYVNGLEDFAVIVALLRSGTTLAGWIWHPAPRVMYHARLHQRSWCGARAIDLKDMPTRANIVGGISSRLGVLDEVDHSVTLRRCIFRRSHSCAAVDYMRVLDGQWDFVVFAKVKPWDHAAGILMTKEAGGFARYLDGREYDMGLSPGVLLVARDEGAWQAVSLALGEAAAS